MGLKPSKTTVTPESAASPFAKDFLSFLQGQLDEGTFGMGAGPLQRTAGRSAIDLLNSSSLGELRETGSPFDLTDLYEKTGATFGRDVNRQAGDLREAFGAAGSRYGSTLATGEGRMREGALQDYEELKAKVGLAAHEGAQGRRLQANQFTGQLALGTGRMGLENLAPFIRALELGTFPSETYFGPSTFSQVTGAIGNIAGAAGSVMGAINLGKLASGGGAGATGAGAAVASGPGGFGIDPGFVPTSVASTYGGVGDAFWDSFGNRTQGQGGYFQYY